MRSDLYLELADDPTPIDPVALRHALLTAKRYAKSGVDFDRLPFDVRQQLEQLVTLLQLTMSAADLYREIMRVGVVSNPDAVPPPPQTASWTRRGYQRLGYELRYQERQRQREMFLAMLAPRRSPNGC